jgi:phosphohistidine phosphatase SixA
MRVREPADVKPLRLLLRHADAGIRGESKGADEWRALSPLGWVQAEEVAARVGDLPILRIMSSPSLRCRQTVVPLARRLALDIEPCSELAVDADPGQLVRFLQDPQTEAAVLCTHRETLETLFTQLALGRTVVPEHDSTMEMAATWLLRGAVGDSSGVHLQYLPAQRSGPGAAVPSPRADRCSTAHRDGDARDVSRAQLDRTVR